MESTLKKTNDNKFLASISVLVILASFAYDGYAYWKLYTHAAFLEERVSELETKYEVSKENLSQVEDEKTAIVTLLQVEKANTTLFQDQIQNIAGTVGVLEKLSKTDPELLEKYSKVYFLNENYIPQKLSFIDQKYLYDKDKPIQMHADVLPHLTKLLDEALAENVTMQVISGYRSFVTQAYLKSSYKITYGAGTANKFSADQGYSEHQLGTAVDFTTPSIGATFVGFDKSNAYKWLNENAYKYGFILSYPKNNTYYTFEPWHFRFVGIALATRLHNENKLFYDLDQRDMDQYLVNLFD